MNISIPAQIQQNFQSAVDTFLNNVLSRQCTLYYPPLQVACPNLTLQGDFSNSYWITGDPQYIHSQQLCPLCNGSNLISQEQAPYVITMAIYWKASQFSKIFPVDFRHEEGIIQTKGYCSDLTKVLNCTRMSAFNDLGTDHYNYKLYGQPVVPGKVVKSRYFYALWKVV